MSSSNTRLNKKPDENGESGFGAFHRPIERVAFERRTPCQADEAKQITAPHRWNALEQLAPFGMDNGQPLFGARGVKLAGPPQVWKEKHARFAVMQGKRTLMMKGWNMASQASEFRGEDAVDVAFEVERGWMGGWGVTVKAIHNA